jgi:DNA-binding transcriptional MerR regulator
MPPMKVETAGMLTIGRFARLTGLTVKALRHYDEIRLLAPAHVDAWTGYRWYEPSQVADAIAVRRLRELRLPLEQAAALIKLDDGQLREALAVHRARLEGDLVETRQILAELDRLIEGKEHLVTQVTVDFTLADEPAGRYAVLRDRVRVDDMFTHVPQTCVRLCAELEQRGIPYLAPALTVFLGNGIDEWLDVEVGWPIGDVSNEGIDGVIIRELPSARVAEHVHTGPYEELPALYGALEDAIRSRDLEPQDLAREHYLVSPQTETDPSRLVTRIVWPVA